MKATNRVRRALVAGAIGGTLAACGGGGGDSAPMPPGGGTSVALSGTAAKGLMANADVAAFAVASDGSVGSTALASATTDAAGHYTLSFAATQNQPYVVRVTAKSDGSTTHLDEVSGTNQPLPAGFTMRALLVPTTTGTLTTSANVTPFSELAVAAAARASGGITKANADQAVSTLRQLLGFDPAAVAVKPAGSAGASEDENKQAILLLAVSQLAGGGALGCASGTAGEKVRCVVDTLAGASSTTSIKLQSGSTDVSAALGGAVSSVLGNATLNGGVAASTLSTVTANLACTTNCAAASVSTVAVIDSAKALFAQIKTDWSTMFSRGGASAIATGAANAEAWKFRQAMEGTQVPLATAVKDLGALVVGVDLYNDYKAGRTTAVSRGRAQNDSPLEAVATDTPLTAAQFDAIECTLFQDLALTTEASTPANAGFIGCRASYFVNVVGNVRTDWRHGFTLTPTGNGGFDYTNRLRKRIRTCVNGTCTFTTETLQPNSYAGTLTTTTDAAGSLTGFAVSGELGASFTNGAITLADDHASWSMSGTRTPSGTGGHTDSITGSFTSKDAGGAALGTLAIRSGTIVLIPMRHDTLGRNVKPGSPQDAKPGGTEPDSGTFDIGWATPTAAFDGQWVVAPSLWDKSGYDRVPASTTLSGTLSTLTGGTTTEFVKGTLVIATQGFEAFDNTLPDTATNFYTRTASFTGSVTAPGRPTLALTLSTSTTTFDEVARNVALQYRVLVGNEPPRTVVDVNASRDTAGVLTWTFAEATSGLELRWKKTDAQATLRKGSEVVGVLDVASRLLTFSDHSVISLDIGL